MDRPMGSIQWVVHVVLTLGVKSMHETGVSGVLVGGVSCRALEILSRLGRSGA